MGNLRDIAVGRGLWCFIENILVKSAVVEYRSGAARLSAAFGHRERALVFTYFFCFLFLLFFEFLRGQNFGVNCLQISGVGSVHWCTRGFSIGPDSSARDSDFESLQTPIAILRIHALRSDQVLNLRVPCCNRPTLLSSILSIRVRAEVLRVLGIPEIAPPAPLNAASLDPLLVQIRI